MTPSKTLSALQGWSGVARWTLFGTLGCMLVSIIVTTVLFDGLDSAVQQRALLGAALLPCLLGGPLFFYMSLRLRGLALANHRLGLVARTDSLTACLTRGAFTDKVSALLAKPGNAPSGTLLMIDADNFKAINDLFGHDAGDQALTLIARAIRSVLRAGDLVGRMGGEEFGVYLPGADNDEAASIAEQIRQSVNLVMFAPAGRPRQLSVSIGGAVFSGEASFSALFRIADQRLYGAKQTGRNRVTIVHADDHPEIELSRSA